MNISNIRTRFYLAKFSFQLTNILLSLTIEFFTNHHKGGGRLYSKLSPLSFAEYRIYIYIYFAHIYILKNIILFLSLHAFPIILYFMIISIFTKHHI